MVSAGNGNNDGLPPAFIDLIEVMDAVSDMLATTRLEGRVVQRVMAEIPNRNGSLRTKSQAKKLVSQAKEYMASGFQSRRQHSQALYLRRLEKLIERIEPHVISELAETVVVADLDAGGAATGKKRMKTRVRKNIFNAAAAALLVKTYKEAAMLTGGRRGDNPVNVNFNQNNLAIGARATNELPTEELARSLSNVLGLEIIDVRPATPILPESPAPEASDPTEQPGP